MSIYMLAGWLLFVLAVVFFRLLVSWRWRKNKSAFAFTFFHVLMGLSGVAWGIAGWMSQYSQNSLQQLITGMLIIFYIAGVLVGYAGSLLLTLFAVLPAVLPWVAALLIAGNFDLTLTGIAALVCVAVGITLARFARA